MSTPSFFDLFKPPQPQAGLPGLAMNLQQRGPQGLGERLGAGILGASEFAQQALPGVMQDPNAGFGAAFGASLLSGLGAPARQAVSQEETRKKQAQALQVQMLGKVFEKLDPESQTQILEQLGLGDLEMAKGESKTYQQTIRTLVGMLGKKDVPLATQKSIKDALKSDPSISGLMSQIELFAPTGGKVPPDQVLVRMSSIYTDKSFDQFMSPEDPGYLDWRILDVDPKKLKKGAAGRSPSYQDQAAISDLERRKEFIAQGHAPDIASQLAVADQEGNVDEMRLANMERIMGITAGTEPKDPLQAEVDATARFYGIAAQGLAGSFQEPEQIVSAGEQLRGQAEKQAAARIAEAPAEAPTRASARRMLPRQRLTPEAVKALRGGGPGAQVAEALPAGPPIPDAIRDAPPDAQGFTPLEIYQAMWDLGLDMDVFTTPQAIDAYITRLGQNARPILQQVLKSRPTAREMSAGSSQRLFMGTGR